MRTLVGYLCLVVTILCLPPRAAAKEKDDDLVLGWYASGSGGMIDRRWAFGADAFLDLSVKGFRMTVGAPLRFHGDGFRDEHWDEVTDFGRLAREISYERPDLGLSLKIAPVSGLNLGVGNLVSFYNSTVDADHWRTGFTGSFHSKYGGIDVFLDSFLPPEMAGGRLYVRPFEAIHPGGFAGRLEIAGTLLADFRAPREFQRIGRRITLAGANLPSVDREAIIGAGIDVRWPVYRGPLAELVPYVAMSMVEDGSGLHVGLALDIYPSQSFRFGLAGEWRYLGAHYLASYFDSMYMVERFDFESGDPFNAKTKARVLDDVVETRMGAMAMALFEMVDTVTTWIQLDWDNQSRFSQLRLGLDLNVLDLVGLRVSLVERGFPTFTKLFDPDRFMVAAAVDVNITRNVTVFGSYSRDLSIARSGDAVGLYRPTDGFLVGLRVGFQYERGKRDDQKK
ncbi:MAG: hypothetical protein ISR64_05940 [Deltaproteobacteria bacterium]|nr:hypothetical protein [Deltaproteobacteria bacterium]